MFDVTSLNTLPPKIFTKNILTKFLFTWKSPPEFTIYVYYTSLFVKFQAIILHLVNIYNLLVIFLILNLHLINI